MKGRIISDGFKFQVQYTNDEGVKKQFNLTEDTVTKYLYVGLEVDFEEVWIGNPNAEFTTETGWSEEPIKEIQAEIIGRGYDPKLYSEIENSIIRWSIDGTRTGGSLTREIMEILLQESWEDVEEEYQKDEYPTFGGPFTDAKTPFEWLKLNYYSPKRK